MLLALRIGGRSASASALHVSRINRELVALRIDDHGAHDVTLARESEIELQVSENQAAGFDLPGLLHNDSHFLRLLRVIQQGDLVVLIENLAQSLQARNLLHRNDVRLDVADDRLEILNAVRVLVFGQPLNVVGHEPGTALLHWRGLTVLAHLGPNYRHRGQDQGSHDGNQPRTPKTHRGEDTRGPGRYSGNMARKPTLSPSRITTFLACPVKYKWTYVDRRGRWYLRSKAHYSFGTSLHNVLQRFYDSKDGGVTTTEEAVAALEEAWIDAGYESQSDMMEALAEGKDILTNYLEEVAAPVTANTLFVEKTLRHDLGPFVLLGRIDRLDEHEDGTLDVVDYKSGRGHVTSEEVHADLAMGVYQVLVRANYPDRNVKATIVALRAGASASAQLNEAEREEFINDLVEIGERILHADYESMEPTPKALCPRCDFLPLCQKHPDFAEGVKPWLAQASPAP